MRKLIFIGASFIFVVGLMDTTYSASLVREFSTDNIEPEIEDLETFEYLPLTSVEITCNCDVECNPPKPIKPKPPVRGYW